MWAEASVMRTVSISTTYVIIEIKTACMIVKTTTLPPKEGMPNIRVTAGGRCERPCCFRMCCGTPLIDEDNAISCFILAFEYISSWVRAVTGLPMSQAVTKEFEE